MTTDNQSKQQEFDGDHAELVRLLKETFSSLRLFANGSDPLSARNLIAHARYELDRYKRWQESGTPISGIVVRLIDGEEVGITKPTSRIMTIPYSRAELLPRPALKVYKKADKHFGEVLLYVVEVNDVPPEGLIFRKTYPNKQSLFLRIEHEEERQLKVSVNYTPAPEHIHNASPEGDKRTSFVRSTLFSPFGLLSKYPPSWAAVITLIVAVGLLFATMNLKRSNSDQVATDVHTRANIKAVPASVPIETNVIRGPDAPLGAPSEKQRPPSYIDVNAKRKINPVAASVPTGIATSRRASATTLASLGRQRIQIYVKAFAMDDKRLERTLFQSFVKALEKTDRFIIWTDKSGREVPKGIYEISLYFSPEEGRYGFAPAEGHYGTIMAILYNQESMQIWQGSKTCPDYPKEIMLTVTSKEMVTNMLPVLADSLV
ncbi:MAG TPA: hypothetical protein VGC66_22085 [Pyrinomonadaceae bacterium]|jgi:hypothetical protein